MCQEYQAVVDAEWSILYNKLDKIHQSGAKVVLSKLPIGDVATQYFADRFEAFISSNLSWLSGSSNLVSLVTVIDCNQWLVNWFLLSLLGYIAIVRNAIQAKLLMVFQESLVSHKGMFQPLIEGVRVFCVFLTSWCQFFDLFYACKHMLMGADCWQLVC